MIKPRVGTLDNSNVCPGAPSKKVGDSEKSGRFVEILGPIHQEVQLNRSQPLGPLLWRIHLNIVEDRRGLVLNTILCVEFSLSQGSGCNLLQFCHLRWTEFRTLNIALDDRIILRSATVAHEGKTPEITLVRLEGNLWRHAHFH